MGTAAKRSSDPIRVKQYVVDGRGHKVGAIIDMKELSRLNRMLQLIPPSEAWLYENPEALETVSKGLKDAAQGKVSKLDLKDL